MAPEPEPAPAKAFEGSREKSGVWDHEKGRRRDRDDRTGGRDERPRRGRSDVQLTTYRIAVGKRHKVEPRQIVGAIANEGGLSRADFGHIDIRGDHSLVELPENLPQKTLSALERTRISGKLIELTPAAGPRPSGSADRTKKPRTKNRG